MALSLTVVLHRLAPDDALQAHLPHQARDRAASDVEPFALHLAPDLADTIDAKVVVKHTPDFALQIPVAPGTSRQSGRIPSLRRMEMEGGRGNRQYLADRLDPICTAMFVGKRNHRLNGRSSSAWAKYADALRNISLA